MTFAPDPGFISYNGASIIASPTLDTLPINYIFSVIYNDDGSKMDFEIAVTTSEIKKIQDPEQENQCYDVTDSPFYS